MVEDTNPELLDSLEKVDTPVQAPVKDTSTDVGQYIYIYIYHKWKRISTLIFYIYIYIYIILGVSWGFLCQIRT